MTTLGAIRWDAWYDMAVNSPGRYVAASLSPLRWQSRAPLHGDIDGASVSWNATQATMDAEIAAAATCVDYWAFLKYPAGGLSNGFTLFQSSSHKADINWCWMTQTSLLGTTGNYATQVAEIVSHMQQSNYQKVLANRPLLYLYYTDADIATYWGGSAANLKAALDAIRTGAVGAGLGDPYMVIVRYSIVSTEALRSTLGMQAVTSYVPIMPDAYKKSWATYAAGTETYWASLRDNASKSVPIMTVGWNPEPRMEIVNPYVAYKPYFGQFKECATLPTYGEITAHVAAAYAFVAANSADVESDTILCYAWNEFDEGGWIAPTHGDPTGLKCAAVDAGRP